MPGEDPQEKRLASRSPGLSDRLPAEDRAHDFDRVLTEGCLSKGWRHRLEPFRRLVQIKHRNLAARSYPCFGNL